MPFFKNTFTCIISLLAMISIVSAQKKPLDHHVYDSWQSVSESIISNNGQYIAYLVNVQEGDGSLYLQHISGDTLAKIPRGYEGAFMPNSDIFVCKIKPYYKEIRQAKIDKKKEDDQPKDSLVIFDLNKNTMRKIAQVKSFQISEKQGSILAWLSEKKVWNKIKEDSITKLKKLSEEADSLIKYADSLKIKVAEAKEKGLKVLVASKKTKKNTTKAEGSDLHLLDFSSKDSIAVTNVTDYLVSEKGNIVTIVAGPSEKDTMVRISYIENFSNKIIASGFKSVKNLTFNEDGKSLAFVADKDSTENSLRRSYSLYLYKKGEDSAQQKINNHSNGLPNHYQVSEYAKLNFSKSADRLFFGTSPILPLKDTSLPEFERVKLDIWHYKEDDLHSSQLYSLERDLKRSYLAMYDIKNEKITQLASPDFKNIFLTEEGDGAYFYTSTDTGRRVSRQWLGSAAQDIYLWDINNQKKTLIIKNWNGPFYPSYQGSNLLLYSTKNRQYQLFNISNKTMKRITGFNYPIYDVENDVPADPSNDGILGWTKDDKSVFVYGQYEIWKVNVENAKASLLTSGRTSKSSYEYLSLDKELKYLNADSLLAFNQYNAITKRNQYVLFSLNQPDLKRIITPYSNYKFASLNKAKEANIWSFTRQNYQSPPNIFSQSEKETIQLSNINQQQSLYNWGTAELYKWKAYTGKETEGILYKPENFDPSKKYPLIAYFYERNNETLYNYQAPAPTPSRLNISFFVSRGYIVFVPDIWYKTGHPGQSAYDYIVSGVRSLVKKGFVDSSKMGIQGQSWGGYQTAYLITKVPNMFAAAWAGAPVVNMFSAYGGIRWESGMNRQFQYEKTQSRIGTTIWENPSLYIENSPLFNLPKVKTPVVIMSNDADGAVPWYQGIEMFTDLRRLGKPSWLLNYNGEAHNLVLRKNRKDIQIREQQFFDWLLKSEKPAPWIVDGVPAIMKDKTMGLSY